LKSSFVINKSSK